MNRQELISDLVSTQGYKATRLKNLSVEQLQELVICDEVTLTKAQHTEYMLELDDARQTNMRLNRELVSKQGEIERLRKQNLQGLSQMTPQELYAAGYVTAERFNKARAVAREAVKDYQSIKAKAIRDGVDL